MQTACITPRSSSATSVGFPHNPRCCPPRTLAQLLGQWFREAGNTVQKHGGVIDKFIGDAILAYWQENPGPPRRVHERVQVAARQSARPRGEASSGRNPASSSPSGIAVHYGRVAFGNIGLVAQRDATIIGNAVNTAFRLESVMKELGPEDCSSARTWSTRSTRPARALFTDLGEKSLKGLSDAVRVFGIAT